jgi:hypothetical protein
MSRTQWRLGFGGGVGVCLSVSTFLLVSVNRMIYINASYSNLTLVKGSCACAMLSNLISFDLSDRSNKAGETEISQKWPKL